MYYYFTVILPRTLSLLRRCHLEAFQPKLRMYLSNPMYAICSTHLNFLSLKVYSFATSPILHINDITLIILRNERSPTTNFLTPRVLQLYCTTNQNGEFFLQEVLATLNLIYRSWWSKPSLAPNQNMALSWKVCFTRWRHCGARQLRNCINNPASLYNLYQRNL